MLIKLLAKTCLHPRHGAEMLIKSLLLLFYFLQLYCPNGIFPMRNLGCFPWGKPAATESHCPTYCACWVFSVSIIHQTLTWTTGSLTRAQVLMHAIAHGGVQTHIRESALKVGAGRKIPCRFGESYLHQRRDSVILKPTELHMCRYPGQGQKC